MLLTLPAERMFPQKLIGRLDILTVLEAVSWTSLRKFPAGG